MDWNGPLAPRYAAFARCAAVFLALLPALACMPAAAGPVFTAGAEADKDVFAGRIGDDAMAKLAVRPALDASLQKGAPKATESVSEWARFMKSVRAFFGRPDEDIEMRQSAKAVRVDPAFATSLIPGAFDASGGGTLPGSAADADRVQAQAQAAARDLLRDLSRAAGRSTVVAAASPAANNPPAQAAGERKPGEGSKAAQKSPGDEPGQGQSLEDLKPASFVEPEANRVQKTAEQKAFEGMLFTQFVDQATPWAIGLAGLFIFWQVIRLLIHVLQAAQMRAVRRAAEDAAQAPRARR